jgi:2,3-diaminopropionate biosynthesis protein SbnB
VHDRELVVVRGPDVAALLMNREIELMDIIEEVYKIHARGGASTPQSVFLCFADHPENRIIALPGYLGGGLGIAGVKWISSFPNNINTGQDRASGILILSSATTGTPQAVLETSIISAKRTAASAVVAARALHLKDALTEIAMIGCGLINFEIARFLRALYPTLDRVHILDSQRTRAECFERSIRNELGIKAVNIESTLEGVLSSSSLISIATTAAKPHIDRLNACQPGALILHVSLRDLSAEAIRSCDNVVDDIDHVCRAGTSVHLAEQLTGSRAFIRGTLGDVLLKRIAPRVNDNKVTVFSPFGLGILDLAIGKRVLDLSVDKNTAITISSFLPVPWRQAAFEDERSQATVST